MKLAYFNDFTLGIVKDDSVVEVSSVVRDIPHLGPHDLISGLIERWEQYRERLQNATDSSEGIPLSRVRLRAPLPRPGKMLCMARNFIESPNEEVQPLNAFLKSPNAVSDPGSTVVLPSAQAAIFEHEAELALVIGKRASHIKAANAYEHVFGYVNFMDVSARGLAVGNLATDTFFPGKSWHTFAPMGPYLVTADEVPDPQHLQVKLWVNDELRQNYSMTGMARTIAESLEWASGITPLDPGDIFSCGTNHRGLGPLQDGDVVEMEAAGLGRLRVGVKDALRREWPRLTRAQKETAEAAHPS